MVFNAFVFWSRVLNFATVLIFDPWRRYKLFYRFAHWHQVNFVDSRLETYFHFIIMITFSDYILKRIDYWLDICYINRFRILCYLSYIHYLVRYVHRNTRCNIKIVCHTLNNIKHKGHGCSNGQLTFNSSSISHSFFSKAFFSFFSVSVRPPELATYISIKMRSNCRIGTFYTNVK